MSDYSAVSHMLLWSDTGNSFQPHSKKHGTELLCVATDLFCLDNAIRFALTHGLALDSTWRNMTENFTPLTFLVTENINWRMVPGLFLVLSVGFEM